MLFMLERIKYGAKKGKLWTDAQRRSDPMGRYSARPFFGDNDQDQADVLELCKDISMQTGPQSWWQRFLDLFRRLF